ncbi:ABC transporter ATP-binding protein [Sporomusa sp.]|uniref:ABC transporter ATP-binding protein n=1 Tax=Sporomusa sp. TaxID=2078658 RepID=UPI002B5BECC1|nr:ABC transporter ATP-binding protein [Sporomusa sp.]HWR41726.1 ABC transporter ATP-binding protein [Sporomusa sp.]
MILQAKGVSKRFGGLKAVKNVSMEVPSGSIFGLIGPNGAGKTTFLNSVAGYYNPEDGEVWFNGKNITRYSAAKICHCGMARTFQIVHSFPQLSILENVMVGAIFGDPKRTEKAEVVAARMLDFVEFPLSHQTLAGDLNTIQLKRLEMARALSTNCQLLLLDEVAAGLTPGELVDLTSLIRKIRQQGTTIIMVEHLMKLIMDVCDQIAVLYFGEKIAEGNPTEIFKNDRVTEAYLGCNYLL